MLTRFFRNAWTENRSLVRFLVFLLLALAAGWLAYAVFGHRLIESVYRGERFPSLARLFEDRDTRPVESYFQRFDTLLLLLSAYATIGAATVASLAFRPRNHISTRLWYGVVCAAVVTTMLFVAPTFYGDGPEYLLMTESLADHASPELRDADLESLKRLEEKSNFSFSRRDPRQYYFESRGGAIYSYHFWLYSALNVPAKFVLRLMRANEGKVFQITNALLLAMALLHVVFLSGFDERRRRLFGLLVFFSPALWFVYWPHPEVFSFALTVMALVCVSRGWWKRAVLWAALASTQNQPLLILVAYLWIRGVVAPPRRVRDGVLLAFSAAPALLPNAFFYYHFGVGSLLAREAASFSNVGIQRALELFFDPNIGMLPYLPVVLIFFVVLVVRDIARRRAATSVQFAVVLFVMALACTPTYLWNHGTTGPSRYVVWMLPLVFYALVEAWESPRRWIVAVLEAGIAFQALLLVALGGLAPPITQMSHTYMARFLLNRVPAIYNPTPEIFAVRTSHKMPEITYSKETGYHAELPATPIVYRASGHCRKALIRAGEEAALESACGGTVPLVRAGTAYVSY